MSEKERMAKLRSEKEMKKVNHKRKNESNLDISHKAFFFETTLFRIVNNAQFLYMPFFCWYLQKKQDFFSRIFFLILFSFLLSPYFFLEYEMRAIFRVWWKDYFRYLKTALTHFHSSPNVYEMRLAFVTFSLQCIHSVLSNFACLRMKSDFL